MFISERIGDARARVRNARREGFRIGFVPTMGALHLGHKSLIDAARRDCGYVAVSIFVNPTQFAPHEDLQKYPRPRDADLAMCLDAGADLVFYPTVEEMYRPHAMTQVAVSNLTNSWEGAIRPGHFAGVTTVVAKLFHIIEADIAYFGQKDYQQQAVIRQMVRDLDFPVEIRTCPTIRDPDGLAMSSRNAYLTPEQRQAGLCLSRALSHGEVLFHDGKTPAEISNAMQSLIAGEPGVILDYAQVVDPDRLESLTSAADCVVALVAARVGSTRLIDNGLWQKGEAAN